MGLGLSFLSLNFFCMRFLSLSIGLGFSLPDISLTTTFLNAPFMIQTHIFITIVYVFGCII